MDLGIKGRTALVMGSSAGIGRAVAASLVKEGAKVAISARDQGRAESAARELGADSGWAADFGKPSEARALVDKLVQRWGSLDILVVNTGGPPKGKFPDVTDAQWQVGFQSLWLSAVDSIQAALPSMRKKRWGRIVLITSVAAREPMPGLTVSNGLRAGLLGLTRSLSHEIAGDGVTINAVLPGYTDTERLRELGVSTDKIVTQIPAGRLARSEEMGDLTAFLASDRAGYITGQAIASDGGYLRGI